MRDFIRGNQLRLLRNGQGYFPALLAAIHAARQEVFLETYIFELDEVGTEVARALMDAAQRGLDIKVQIDGFGAREFPRLWQDKMLQAGVKLLFFRPEIGRFLFDRTRLRRLHRKLVVIDGEIGFVGGINIISDYNQQPIRLPPRYDYAVEVRGPVVRRMHATVDHMWRQTAWVRIKPEWRKKSRLRPSGKSAGTTLARFVTRDNLRHRRSIEVEYLDAIENARHEIIIANAYFLPGLRFRHALMRASERGVRVTLLLQGLIDHAILHFATRGYYHQFLSAGIEIHEYREGFMHAKVAVIDGRWSTVGSSNIDPFSLLLAREANLFVHDIAFAAILRADLLRVLQECATQVRLADLDHAKPIQRLLPWACFGIVRLLMGISGYGGSHYLE